MPKPMIYMDERERGEMRAALLRMQVDCRILTMEVGDFVISPTIGIERKRGDDFASSLVDGRLFTQTARLKEVFPQPILILERFEKMFARQIRVEALYGALLYLTQQLHIGLIPSQSAEETALILKSLATYSQKNLPVFDYTPPKVQTKEVSRESQIYFLQGLVGVSETRATHLLDHFHTPWNVITAICDASESKAKKKKGLNGLSGFGPQFIEKNQMLLGVSSPE